MWKFKKFSVIQILREINVGVWRLISFLIITNLEDMDFLGMKTRIKFQRPQKCQLIVLRLLIWFHVKSER